MEEEENNKEGRSDASSAFSRPACIEYDKTVRGEGKGEIVISGTKTDKNQEDMLMTTSSSCFSS